MFPICVYLEREKEMIIERVEAGWKNIEWLRRDFIKRPGIRIMRISQISPVKDKKGVYCFHVQYIRVADCKRIRKRMCITEYSRN